MAAIIFNHMQRKEIPFIVPGYDNCGFMAVRKRKQPDLGR